MNMKHFDVATGQVPSAVRLMEAQDFIASLALKTPDSQKGRYFLFDRQGENPDPAYTRAKEELGVLNIRFEDSGSSRSSKSRIIVSENEVPKLETAISMSRSRLGAKASGPAHEPAGV